MIYVNALGTSGIPPFTPPPAHIRPVPGSFTSVCAQ